MVAIGITPGQVVWITGLSGVGKSTVARQVVTIVRQELRHVVLLDGDLVREVVGDGLRHHHSDRLANAYRISRLAAYLSRQGIHVVCATMSLFPEIWRWNRENLPRYFEVYLRAPIEQLEARDPKGLYARARRGEEHGVVGVDLPFLEPTQPHLVLDNDQPGVDTEPLARAIAARCGILP